MDLHSAPVGAIKKEKIKKQLQFEWFSVPF